MAKIPGLETQSQVNYTPPQVSGQNAAIQAKGQADQAGYNLRNSQFQGGLKIAEQIAALAFRHRNLRDQADMNRAKIDWMDSTTAFENENLSDTTAYQMVDANSPEPPEQPDQENAELIAALQLKRTILTQKYDMNHDAKEGMPPIWDQLKAVEAQLQELKALPDPKSGIKPAEDGKGFDQRPYRYEQAGDAYTKMVEDYESRWGLNGGDAEGGLSKRAQRLFAPWLEEQKIKTGDFVHDKSTLYGNERVAAEQEGFMEEAVDRGDAASLVELGQQAVETGIFTPQYANKLMDTGMYMIAYNTAKEMAVGAVGSFDIEKIESGEMNPEDAWFMDGTSEEEAMAILEDNLMYENYDGTAASLKPKDVENIRSAVKNEWNQVQQAHQRWRVDEAYQYVNDGIDLFYQGNLTMEYLDDFRGNAFSGGPYGQGGGREYLRRLMTSNKAAVDMPNAFVRAQMWPVIMDTRLSNEVVDNYINKNLGELGLNGEEAFQLRKWVKERRNVLFNGPATGYPGMSYITEAFEKQIAAAQKDGDFDAAATLQQKMASATERFATHVVDNLTANIEYYRTKDGAAELAALPGEVVKFYLDEQFQKDFNKTKGAVYSQVDSLIDPLALSAAENVMKFFQGPGGGVFRREYAEGLMGLEDVLGRNWARVSGKEVNTFITANNTIELFMKGRGGDYNPETMTVENVLNSKYVRYNEKAGANGISYTYRLDGKKMRQYVFDPDLNDWVPVTEDMGVQVVDLYSEGVSRIGPGAAEQFGETAGRIREGKAEAAGDAQSGGRAARELERARELAKKREAEEAKEAERKLIEELDLGSSAGPGAAR